MGFGYIEDKVSLSFVGFNVVGVLEVDFDRIMLEGKILLVYFLYFIFMFE